MGTIDEVVADLKRRVEVLEGAKGAAKSASAPPITGAIAPDSDLDSKFGDPIVKFDPRDWKGQSCKNKHYSTCPSAYLLLMASALEFFGNRKAANGEDDKSAWDFRDAARARGWAARNQSISAALAASADEAAF